jgi:hypothetical protein
MKKQNLAFQLKITLTGSKPPIWRRILVPSDFTFHDLHLTIQVAFDWMNYHLYCFEKPCPVTNNMRTFSPEGAIVDMSIEDNKELGTIDCRKEKIKKYFKEKGDKMIYTYDFGDDWEHKIALEKIIDGYEFNYPQCLKAVRCSPADDSGGIWGWEEKIEKMQNYNPKNEEHVEIFEWLQGVLFEMDEVEDPRDFDPKRVDLGFINEELKDYKNTIDVLG